MLTQAGGEAFVLIGNNALHLANVEQVDGHLHGRVVHGCWPDEDPSAANDSDHQLLIAVLSTALDVMLMSVDR